MRFGELVREFGLIGYGLVGAAAALSCIAIDPRAALTGWLAAAVLLQSLPLGALVLLAMMRLIRGQWEAELRSGCEAAAGLWFLSALAFVPVLLGLGAIYDWPHAPAQTALQDMWLNVPPFVLRTLLWFVALAAIARSQVGGHASAGASALALIVMILGAWLLAADWFMTLDIGFHSWAFGLQVFALEMCTAYAALLLLRLTRRVPPQRPALLGALMVAFLLLWLCFQAVPYLAIWSDDLPAGAEWYAVRAEGGWRWVPGAIGLLGIVPLLALLLPLVRRSQRALAFAAVSVLVGKSLEFAWIAIPGRGQVAVLSFLFALCGFACFAASYLAPGTRWRFPGRRSAA